MTKTGHQKLRRTYKPSSGENVSKQEGSRPGTIRGSPLQVSNAPQRILQFNRRYSSGLASHAFHCPRSLTRRSPSSLGESV